MAPLSTPFTTIYSLPIRETILEIILYEAICTVNLLTTIVAEVMAVIRHMKKAGFQEVFTCLTTIEWNDLRRYKDQPC
jgi:hypothetical protein